MPITHAYQSATPDDPGEEISSAEWNAAHVGDTTIANDTIWNAKGDIVVATGPDAAQRVPIQANGFVLKGDNTTATGVVWYFIEADEVWYQDDEGAFAVEAGSVDLETVFERIQIGNTVVASAQDQLLGEMLYANGDNRWVAVGTGGEGEYLRFGADGYPYWEYTKLSAYQSTPNLTWTTNTTLSDVTGTAIALEANGKYEVITNVIYNGGTTGDIAFTFTLTNTPLQCYWWAMNGLGTGAANTTNAIKVDVGDASATPITYGAVGTSTALPIELKMFIECDSDPITVQLQAAQSVSNGTTTTVQTSWMTATRLA